MLRSVILQLVFLGYRVCSEGLYPLERVRTKRTEERKSRDKAKYCIIGDSNPRFEWRCCFSHLCSLQLDTLTVKENQKERLLRVLRNDRCAFLRNHPCSSQPILLPIKSSSPMPHCSQYQPVYRINSTSNCHKILTTSFGFQKCWDFVEQKIG